MKVMEKSTAKELLDFANQREEIVAYYHVTHIASWPNVVGVIKSVNGEFDRRIIETALSAYLEEAVKVKHIEEHEHTGDISITAVREDGNEVYFEGGETYLYI